MTSFEALVDLARQGNRLLKIDDCVMMDMPVYDVKTGQNIIIKVLIDLRNDGPAVTVGRYGNFGFVLQTS
jgi:hypothetical protein